MRQPWVYLHRIGLLLWLLVLGVVGASVSANAAELVDESIPRYDVTVAVHPDQTLDVTEEIIYDFASHNRPGIITSIFLPYIDTDGVRKHLSVDVVRVLLNGVEEFYSTSLEGDYLRVTIGDPDTYVTGQQTYTIEYTVEGGVIPVDGQYRIHWFGVDAGWSVPIQEAAVTVIDPTGQARFTDSQCISGNLSLRQPCRDFVDVVEKSLRSYTVSDLDPGQGLMMTTTVEKGFFQPAVAAVVVAEPVISDNIESILSYDINVEPQSNRSLLVTELINYNFGRGKRHGIYRNIPVVYESDEGEVKQIHIRPISITRDGNTEPFERSFYNGNIVFKIGDADKTITGHHVYEIVYKVTGAVLLFEDHDEVYWNAIGTDWKVPIQKATVTVLDPAGTATFTESTCYLGSIGSQNLCQVEDSSSPNQRSYGATGLNPHQGMTVVVPIEKGFFIPPTQLQMLWERYRDFLPIALPAVTLMVLIGLWLAKVRRPKRQAIIPRYEPPQGLKPFFMGTVIDGKMDPRDISAGIVYLAEQGYIRIQRLEKKWLLGLQDYQFTLLKTDAPDSLESQILDILFPSLRSAVPRGWQIWRKKKGQTKANSVGSVIKISELKKSPDMSTAIRHLKKTLEKSLITLGYFDKKVDKISTGMTWISIIGLVAGNIILEFLSSWIFIPDEIIVAGSISLIFILVASFVFKVRTVKGQRAKEEILGFKDFLSVTEKDRYDFHNAPERSPEQFMQYLPYAIALGVEKKWAKQFEGITIPQPNWYEGAVTSMAVANFVATDFVSDISGFTKVVNSGFAAGASGSGGGVGGGAGGGGGGSW
jgi:uncharacterized membrane protein